MEIVPYKHRVSLRMIVGGIEHDHYVTCDDIEVTSEDYIFFRNDEPTIQHSVPRRNVVGVWVSDDNAEGSTPSPSGHYEVSLTPEQARFLILMDSYIVQSPLQDIADELRDHEGEEGAGLYFEAYDKSYLEMLGEYDEVQIHLKKDWDWK